MNKYLKKELSNAFNKNSGKIIRFKEYRTLEKKLLSEKLSTKEKIIKHCLNLPFEISVGALSLFKGEGFNGQKTYVENAQTTDFYFDAAETLKTEKSLYEKGPNKAFQEKALRLRIQAIEECADHSHRIKRGELRRLVKLG